ncbi:hypothetical protein Poly24_41810 [Rosistilla carotiformis]|uniref:Uncharacterized protein n=1 Tax=Rosistilla carotiformis TaxID=2528017 RepID=A0A518JY40_9BACT|nr:hypothetical protein [Rosistilla carotiformis]QDV70457.1 hypothetical protein Poly24_41810 [Rosistilla carotiformis]
MMDGLRQQPAPPEHGSTVINRTWQTEEFSETGNVSISVATDATPKPPVKGDIEVTVFPIPEGLIRMAVHHGLPNGTAVGVFKQYPKWMVNPESQGRVEFEYLCDRSSNEPASSS